MSSDSLFFPNGKAWGQRYLFRISQVHIPRALPRFSFPRPCAALALAVAQGGNTDKALKSSGTNPGLAYSSPDNVQENCEKPDQKYPAACGGVVHFRAVGPIPLTHSIL